MSSDLHFLVPESFIKNLVQIGKVVSEKIWFEFLYVKNLGPRSRNDLDLKYSHIFIYSIRYLLLLTFRQTWGELIVNANALIMHSFFPVIQDND